MVLQLWYQVYKNNKKTVGSFNLNVFYNSQIALILPRPKLCGLTLFYPTSPGLCKSICNCFDLRKFLDFSLFELLNKMALFLGGLVQGLRCKIDIFYQICIFLLAIEAEHEISILCFY